MPSRPIRREAAAIDPAMMIFDSMPLTEYISASLYGQKVGAILLNVVGGLGLLMAALGLYSVMAYSVAQRTAEIGIRMTLGAKPRDMMLLVLRQGLGFALIGLAVGGLAAAAMARMVAAVLVSVSPADPIVYAGAAGVIRRDCAALRGDSRVARPARRPDGGTALPVDQPAMRWRSNPPSARPMPHPNLQAIRTHGIMDSPGPLACRR